MSSNDRTMSSSLFVPDALKFYVNRLSFSKNRIRLQALSSQLASANSQIIVRLPSNTIINLASLTMTGAVRASMSAPVAGNGVALPTNWWPYFKSNCSLMSFLSHTTSDSTDSFCVDDDVNSGSSDEWHLPGIAELNRQEDERAVERSTSTSVGSMAVSMATNVTTLVFNEAKATAKERSRL